MRPARHDLEVSWWIESGKKYPVTPVDADVAGAAGEIPDRSSRRPLQAREDPPTRKGGAGKDAVSTLRLSRQELEPGEYRITCRVRDTTELRGEKFPWVLKDELGLLESERIWWVLVR